MGDRGRWVTTESGWAPAEADSPVGDIVRVVRFFGDGQTLILGPVGSRPKLYGRLFLDLKTGLLGGGSMAVAEPREVFRSDDRLKVMKAERREGGEEWNVLEVATFGKDLVCHAAVVERLGNGDLLLSTDDLKAPEPKHRRFHAPAAVLPCLSEKFHLNQVVLVRYSAHGGRATAYLTINSPTRGMVNELVRPVLKIQRLFPYYDKLKVTIESGQPLDLGWVFTGRTEAGLKVLLSQAVLGMEESEVTSLKALWEEVGSAGTFVYVDACAHLPTAATFDEGFHLRATKLRRDVPDSPVKLCRGFSSAQTASLASSGPDPIAATKSVRAARRLALGDEEEAAEEKLGPRDDLEVAAMLADAPGPRGQLLPHLREFLADFGQAFYDLVSLFEDADDVMRASNARGQCRGDFRPRRHSPDDDDDEELPLGAEHSRFRPHQHQHKPVVQTNHKPLHHRLHKAHPTAHSL